VSRPFPVRGVIEGFYGPVWSHDARVDLVEFVAARGMNAYVYAPKSDPKHRDRWREPYVGRELGLLTDLAARCARSGVRFGFAISPGVDIDYGDADDRAALVSKLAPMLESGVDWVVLALDDIPNAPGLAGLQADLTVFLVASLRARSPDIRCSLVPTEYVGTRPSPYLGELAAALPPDVDVFWTGPTVCSPRITGEDAAAWRDALGGRPLLLWDNYPVNDAVMERELHLGPYRGRDPGLVDAVDGILCNPMLQPIASRVALATAAAYLREPAAYDASRAWESAVTDVGGSHAGELRALARACSDGPLGGSDTLPARLLVDALERTVDTAEWAPAVAHLRDELHELRDAARQWDPAQDALAAEVSPWLAQAGREADAGTAALRLVQQTHRVAGEDDAAPPDPEAAMLHAFALLFAWSAAREAAQHVVLGPRFALHPAVVQRADGSPALDVSLAVREDESLIDRLARLALDRYARWAAGGADGSWPAPRPPFADARLA
jgi:hyaluronoglucosaminidase